MAVSTAVGALAATDPYTSLGPGYDVSYPQCGKPAPTGTFGIVGINGGRPFNYNSCLSTEYTESPKSIAPSLYINTGYSGAYRNDITPGCSTASTKVGGTSRQEEAWAIGCSEAQTSMSYATQQGASAPAAWWLDVETANSWSSSDLSLNRYAIQGAVTILAGVGQPPVGIYSSASMWSAITGGSSYTPIGVVADWVIADGSCTAAPFTNSTTTVWLGQSTSSGFDADTAC